MAGGHAHPRAMSETVAGAALVTGAGRRLGRSIALELAAGGWFVAVHDSVVRRLAPIG